MNVNEKKLKKLRKKAQNGEINCLEQVNKLLSFLLSFFL